MSKPHGHEDRGQAEYGHNGEHDGEAPIDGLNAVKVFQALPAKKDELTDNQQRDVADTEEKIERAAHSRNDSRGVVFLKIGVEAAKPDRQSRQGQVRQANAVKRHQETDRAYIEHRRGKQYEAHGERRGGGHAQPEFLAHELADGQRGEAENP